MNGSVSNILSTLLISGEIDDYILNELSHGDLLELKDALIARIAEAEKSENLIKQSNSNKDIEPLIITNRLNAQKILKYIDAYFST